MTARCPRFNCGTETVWEIRRAGLRPRWTWLVALHGCLSLVLAGCSNRIPIKTSYDKSAPFQKYHTYALDVSQAEFRPLAKRTLEQSLRARLDPRGLKEVTVDQADLFVVCRIATEQRQESSSVGGRVYFPSTFGRYSGTAGIVQAPQMTEYTYGSLIIDLVDRASRQLVFRGIGSARVDVEEKNAATINTIVSRVVAAIPRIG